jgi:hypothetical protein
MKVKSPLLSLLILLCCSSTVWSDINPFQQRKIVIQGFENRGEKEYDYVGEAIANSVYDYALSIQFLTLTDVERAALKRLSVLEKYGEQFEEAGGKVGYRLEPAVVREAEPMAAFDDTAVYIYGFYEVVSEKKATLSIAAYSSLTGEESTRYQTEDELNGIIRNPESFLVGFFRQFLKYKTHTAVLSTEPGNALIFIDEKLIGVGEARGVLVTPGDHRITVIKDGFRSFSDIIHVREDDFSKKVVLKEEAMKGPIEYAVTPPGTRIYTGERYAGSSPASFELREQDRTVTFIKEGYARRTVPFEEIEDKSTYEASLITSEIKAKLLEDAERHKKGSQTLYYTGLGMVGVSILLGIEKTAYQQRADLYRDDSGRYNEAFSTATTLGYLTAASAAVTAGIFIFSFIELLQYFHLYDELEPGRYNILKGEVRF